MPIEELKGLIQIENEPKDHPTGQSHKGIPIQRFMSTSEVNDRSQDCTDNRTIDFQLHRDAYHVTLSPSRLQRPICMLQAETKISHCERPPDHEVTYANRARYALSGTFGLHAGICGRQCEDASEESREHDWNDGDAHCFRL